MKNPYLPIPVKVGKTFVESEDRILKTLDLLFLNKKDEENFKFIPGQFCEISIWGKGEAPLGIASSPTERGFLRFTVNRAGVVTTALHYLKDGDEVGIRGPLGNHYPVDILKGKNVVIIGGGFAFTTLTALGFPSKRIYTSLEMRMKCGIGMCGRCNIGKFYVCRNGPVFSLAQLESLPQEY